MKAKLLISVLILVFSKLSLMAQIDSTKSIPSPPTKIFTDYNPKPRAKVDPVELSGPRVGFTYITPGKTADFLKNDLEMNTLFTQFGWQFEHQYFALESGVSGLVEFIGLIGGLEQGKFLPSASGLIGIRNSRGGEFAFGPNLSLSGAAFVFAFGHTFQTGDLNFPINFAVVPSSNGVRFSLLTGFNARTK